MAVPAGGTPNVLGSLLDTELSRPVERVPERKAPVHRAETPASSAPQPPAHRALAGGFVLPEAKQAASGWGAGLRIALRSLVGVAGLCYGLLMLWWGACAAWLFLAAFLTKQLESAELWFHIVFVGIALTGVLVAVASVGVLIGRKDAGPKLRFASLILVMLWVFFAGLMAIAPIRKEFDKLQPELTMKFWTDLLWTFSGLLAWAIVPLLTFLWCRFMAKRDLTA